MVDLGELHVTLKAKVHPLFYVGMFLMKFGFMIMKRYNVDVKVE